MIDDYQPPENPTRPFLAEAAEAFVYPFSVRGFFAIFCTALALAVCFSIFAALPPETYHHRGRYTAHGLAITFILLTFWYLLAYVEDIVSESTVGNPKFPDWPNPSEFADNTLGAAWVLLSLIVCMLVPIVAAGFAGLLASPWILSLFLFVGLLYMPMALLATMMFRTPLALSPHIVLPAIWRAPAGVGLAAAVLFAAVSIWRFLGPEIVWPQGGPPGASISFPGCLAANVATLYLLFVAARIIGINYWTHRYELGWFENP